MRQVYWNRHSAAMAVLACMDDFTTTWEHNEHIAESVTAIRSFTTGIFQKAKRQGDDPGTGHTLAKNADMEHLLDLGFLMCLRLHIFARKSGDAILFKETDYVESTFDDGTEEEQIARCSRVAERAAQHLAALASYEVSPGDVAALNAAIEKARPGAARRDAAQAGSTQATASIPQLFIQLSAKLKELDQEIKAFMTKPEQQEFRETYFVARRVKDYKGKAKEKAQTAS
ncbi:MAG: hypothetical protein EOO16_08850 [Chitinophagaceae bacterium]|nr:MAG: hypothetical protein EOO16_08850 [Chitinophagaceae bacterium]